MNSSSAMTASSRAASSPASATLTAGSSASSKTRAVFPSSRSTLWLQGGGLNYVIGNPNAKQDIFVNPNEISFDVGTNFNVPTDASGNPIAHSTPCHTGGQLPSTAGLSLPPAFDTNAKRHAAFYARNAVPAGSGRLPRARNKQVDACFPAVNPK